MSWHKVKVGDFLIRVKDLIPIEKDKEYNLVTIKLYHKGVQLRKKELGANISADKMSRVKAGQFILSGIDARNGAFGIVPPELDSAIVTNDFWHFDIDESIVSKEYFLWLTSTPYFDDICNKASDGTTNRIRLQADRFYSQELFIPEIDSQHEVVEALKKQGNKIDSLKKEYFYQLTLVDQLNQAILQEAVQGKLLKSSPPLKEGKPTGGVVVEQNTSYLPTGGVVVEQNTSYLPIGGVVVEQNTSYLPTGGVVVEQNTREKLLRDPSVLRTAPLAGEQHEEDVRTKESINKKINMYLAGEQHDDVVRNIHNLPYLKTFRKQLRKNLTPAEAKLWTLLKGKQLEGRKFRRQFSVANYILDFYCPSENLAIELDGQGHFEASQAEYDYERDLFLLHCGIKVLRFENKWVWENPEGLLNEVKSSFGWNNTSYLPTGGVVVEQNTREKLLRDPSVLRTAPLAGEQHEEEETGHELLKRIKAEKAKSGKKEKPLPPIKPEEIPFEIPENWVWCRLEEICSEIVDCPHSTPKYLEIDTGYYAIDTTCIDFDGSISRLRNLSEFGYNERIKRLEPKLMDIVFAREGSIGLSAFVPANKKICLGQRVMLFRCAIGVLPEYLKIVITDKKYLQSLLDKHRGIGAKHVNVKDIKLSLIPLPPLSEQKCIVAEIEKQLAKTKQLKEHIIANQQATEQLLKALLHQAFEVGEIKKSKSRRD